MITLYNNGKKVTYTHRDQNTFYRLVNIGIPEDIAIEADGWADLATDGETFYCDENENVILYCV